MESFLNSYFSNLTELKIESLKGDGGHRSYKRLKKGSQTFILMSCGSEDPSLKLFINIQLRLKNFVHVPQIFHYDLKEGFLLLEDLGSKVLEGIFFQSNSARQISFYQKALKQLIKLQTQVKIQPGDPVFDKKFFLKEIEQALYDLELYLQRALNRRDFDKSLALAFKKEMDEVLSYFKPEDYVYCHRDYHSRNLMLKSDQIFMIDFQDAGQGPFFYDLSSLLYDSYVHVEDKQSLLLFYFEASPDFLKRKAQSVTQLERMTQLQFLQRGFKACGRFAAFKNESNRDTHLKYLTPSLQLLERTAQGLDYEGISNYAHFLIQALKEIDIYP